MKKVADEIPAYTYGTPAVAASPVTLDDLEKLKASAGFTTVDEQFLRLAGEVLADQTKQIVEHWRSGIIASIPNLARHSRTPEGSLSRSILRRAIFDFSSGFWTPVFDRTTRIGSITSRRLP